MHIKNSGGKELVWTIDLKKVRIICVSMRRQQRVCNRRWKILALARIWRAADSVYGMTGGFLHTCMQSGPCFRNKHTRRQSTRV